MLHADRDVFTLPHVNCELVREYGSKEFNIRKGLIGGFLVGPLKKWEDGMHTRVKGKSKYSLISRERWVRGSTFHIDTAGLSYSPTSQSCCLAL